jgi:tRNA (guanine10-N2)-dimethyltransferase
LQVAILGRQPELGLAELRAVYGAAELILPQVALVQSAEPLLIDRLGGTRKVGRVIYDDAGEPGKFLTRKFAELPEGKITLGVSHYGKQTVTAAGAQKTARFIKGRAGRSVRVLPNSGPEIADAATLGNRLGTTANKVELLMVYIGHRLVIAELTGVQNLNAYTARDQKRPKRDAKVGMLPPKLAQILVNLAVGTRSDAATPACPGSAVSTSGFATRNTGRATPKSLASPEQPVQRAVHISAPQESPRPAPVLLDPFCGTGVVLQEAALMGLVPYGSDVEPRMVEYSKANLAWLGFPNTRLEAGDATTHKWKPPIDAVASEIYLGQPFSAPPSPEKLQAVRHVTKQILQGFLKNIEPQLRPGVQLALAIPAWRQVDGTFSRLPLDFLTKLGYNVVNSEPLLYHRENQVVARDIIVLRRK